MKNIYDVAPVCYVHYGDREMSMTDGIFTFTVGSKISPWILSIKRKKPWKISVPEKSINLLLD